MPLVRKVLPWSVLLLVTVLPVLGGLVQRQADGWYPESDDATIVLLADDTLRGDPPLVGMISTGGAGLSDPELHHPGPLELYLISPFSRVLGPDLGPTVVATLISVASVAGVVVGLHWIGGRGLAGAGLVTSALILWGIGGDAPTSVWNPHVVLLPFAAFLVHATAAAAGRRWALIGVVTFGSLVAQTHLSYAGLIGVTVLWVGGITAWRLVARRAPLGRAAAVSAGVGAVLWSPPLIDQWRGEPGNLGQIWRSFTGAGGESVGLPGLGELGRVVGAPILGLRPNDDLIRVLPEVSVADLLPLALLAAVLVTGSVLAATRRRRGGHTVPVEGSMNDVVAVATTSLVVLAAGCITAVRIPLDDGVQYQYYGMWMWPLAGVVWTMVALVAWRLAPPVLRARIRPVVRRSWAPPVLGLALLACSALPRPGPWEPWAAYRRVAGDLAPHAADVAGEGPVLVRFRGATPYLSTGSAVALAVASGGDDVLIDVGAPTPVFPWREFRRFTDQPVTRELWVVGGDGSVPPGATLLARVPILDDPARDGIAARIEEALRLVRAGVERGPRRASADQTLGRIEAALDDPERALASGELADLVAQGHVSVDGLSADDLFTLERMRALAAEDQVSLYLVTAGQRP